MANVYVSSVIGAPAAKVWDYVRDFNALPKWVPPVAKSKIDGGEPADKVGCVRDFTLQDGGRLRERLLAPSDREMSCTYSILESPLGVENHVATLRLTPVTDGARTFIEWRAKFSCPTEREADLVALVSNGVFQAAFDTLKAKFG